MTLRCRTLMVLACCALQSPFALAAGNASDADHDYPTQGRVEYVLGCMDDNGHDFANVYKCSCAIDHIAHALPYDDFVEQSTFAKYATLGGEGGSEFRVDRARAQTRKFRVLQDAAYQSCGLGKPAKAAAK